MTSNDRSNPKKKTIFPPERRNPVRKRKWGPSEHDHRSRVDRKGTRSYRRSTGRRGRSPGSWIGTATVERQALRRPFYGVRRGTNSRAAEHVERPRALSWLQWLSKKKEERARPSSSERKGGGGGGAWNESGCKLARIPNSHSCAVFRSRRSSLFVCPRFYAVQFTSSSMHRCYYLFGGFYIVWK